MCSVWDWCKLCPHLSHHVASLLSMAVHGVSSLPQSNTTVTHLDLSDNGLGAEGCIAIITMMKENCYITHLVLYLTPVEYTV